MPSSSTASSGRYLGGEWLGRETRPWPWEWVNSLRLPHSFFGGGVVDPHFLPNTLSAAEVVAKKGTWELEFFDCPRQSSVVDASVRVSNSGRVVKMPCPIGAGDNLIALIPSNDFLPTCAARRARSGCFGRCISTAPPSTLWTAATTRWKSTWSTCPQGRTPWSSTPLPFPTASWCWASSW